MGLNGIKPLSDEYLREVRERCNRATPGPWVWTDEGNGQGGWVRQSAESTPFEASDGLGTIATTMYYNGRRNGPFIAAARTDIPRLLDEIERLKEENERLKHVISGVWNYAMERFEDAAKSDYEWKKEIYYGILREIEKLEEGVDDNGAN